MGSNVAVLDVGFLSSESWVYYIGSCLGPHWGTLGSPCWKGPQDIDRSLYRASQEQMPAVLWVMITLIILCSLPSPEVSAMLVSPVIWGGG